MILNSIYNLILESNELRPRIRVETFAFNKDRTQILAYVKHNNYYPKLPAGAMNVNESYINASKREMMEESGWTGENFKVVDIPGNWVLPVNLHDQTEWFSSWKLKDDIISETNICISCIVKEFKPTTIYASEGDSHEFKLYDVNFIKKLTENSITKNKRVEFQKQFRIVCFKKLL